MNGVNDRKRARVRSRISLLSVLVLGGLAAMAPAMGGVADVYDKVKASVVVIETTQKAVSPAGMGKLVSVGGLGSGVLVSDDGKVMTAAHVVQAADQVSVTFLSGESIPGRVLSSEPAADLALIQLERRPAMAQVAQVGDSDDVRVGHQIFVVGAPFGIDHTLTVGHISARRLETSMFGSFMPTEILQTDAAINTGNSGGPMFNMDGEVVGIVSYIISQSGSFEGLGFVITSNMAKRLLLEGRTMWSGIQGKVLTGPMAAILNVPQSGGVLVEVVADRSPASHLGIRGGNIRAQIEGAELVLGGDIILEVMGLQVGVEDNDQKIRKAMRDLGSGDEIRLKVLRGGEIVELKNFYFPDLLLPKAPEEE